MAFDSALNDDTPVNKNNKEFDRPTEIDMA